jgi:hypothetical protein
MQLPKAVMIHGLADARDALAAARAVTLLSAPGAGLFAGCRWWLELLAAAGATGPALLDCGDAPGRAVEALKCGINGIVLACEPSIFASVAGLAAAQGAILRAAAPPSLDLAARGARRHLAAWLDDI